MSFACCSNLWARSWLEVLRILTAKSAALCEFPMATVATGIPAGIWTIE